VIPKPVYVSRWLCVWLAVTAAAPLLLTQGSARAEESEPREGLFTAPDADWLSMQSQATDTSLIPGFYQTSEFMVGRVAVGLILPESDGTLDPNQSDWTIEQRQQVLNEVTAGLNWWSQQSPQAHLTFVIDDHATTPIATGYEPILHPQSEEGLWISDVLSRLGYSSGSYWTRVRTYVNDLRETYDTDWAFAIFVANSRGDADAAFADHYFAYAYVGGPLMVMTYDNAGYGIVNMDAVTAHETGHIFRALDQYGSAGTACTTRSGYLGVETQNSQRPGCASDVPSIMRGGIYPYTVHALDPYAAGQIGWRDSDGDGLYDPIDTIPTLTVDSTDHVGDVWSYTGHAADTAFPSPLRPSATINAVVVEYRIDSGEWAQAQPADGVFDSPEEGFTLTLDLAASGNHHVTLRTRNSADNVSDMAEFTAVVPDPIDGGLDTYLDQRAAAQPDHASPQIISGEATSFNADGTPGATLARVEYRIDGGEWHAARPVDDAFDSTEEVFVIPLAVGGGTHLIEARAIDVNGKVEQNAASAQLTIDYRTFLPLVQK